MGIRYDLIVPNALLYLQKRILSLYTSRLENKSATETIILNMNRKGNRKCLSDSNSQSAEARSKNVFSDSDSSELSKKKTKLKIDIASSDSGIWNSNSLESSEEYKRGNDEGKLAVSLFR